MEKTFDRYHPFHASLKERFLLSKPGSLKETWHIVLDITDSGIRYKVGDSVAIKASHDPFLVAQTLDALGFAGNEAVIHQKTGQKLSLAEYLANHAVITEPPPSLSQDRSYALWDFALEHPFVMSPQELVDLLLPLLPRFYSIASAQELHKDEIHLTIVVSQYETRGHQRYGVGTHFLCHMPLVSVPLYVQPSRGFTLPHKEAHIIMIGPGTGVAPFRAFMQKRVLEDNPGRNWLFFGEQRKATDFLYEDFWEDLVHRSKLLLSLAFSRDQEEKIYVQDRMMEESYQLWTWLQEGSYLFVCGDANRMAKDVEKALQTIAQKEANLSMESAKEYTRSLRRQGRYLRDIY